MSCERDHQDGRSRDLSPPEGSYETGVEASPSAETLKLGQFPLHSHEWRVAFLLELYMQGYPALLEAVSRAWDLMKRPKAARCTHVGLLAGTGGKGKKALYNFFRAMITEALAVGRPIPKIADYASLDAWHDAVQQQQLSECHEVDQIIQRYAWTLVGEARKAKQPTGEIVPGPWIKSFALA